MLILGRAEIERRLDGLDLLGPIEAAFVAYSQGRAVIPPPGELIFEQPRGDVHIKYGAIRGFDYYVVKIASGFYDNPALGLQSSNGLMLFSASRCR
jgi:ornithine cyclodeaminase